MEPDDTRIERKIRIFPATEPIDTRVGRKIRIFPTEEQKLFFNRCLGTTRFLYNRTLAAIKEAYDKAYKAIRKQRKKGCVHMVTIRPKRTKKSGSKTAKKQPLPKNVKLKKEQCCGELHTKNFCVKHKKSKLKYGVPLSFQYWRNKVILGEADIPEEEKWLNEIPFDTRQLVVKNVIANFKSAITNLRNGHIKKFDLKFKSKKDRNQHFFVDYRALTDDLELWPSKFPYELKVRKGEQRWLENYMKTHKKKQFGEDALEEHEVRSDMIITREYPGMYYLHISYIKPAIHLPPKSQIVAPDPGVITFHTFYDINGNYGKIGDKLAEKLLEINLQIDELQSKITKTNTRENEDGYKKNKMRRQNMRRKCFRLRAKIRNIMNDFHWKTASYYCKNYQTIIIPKMDTESLKKAIKKQFNYKFLSKREIRKLMVLAHNRCVDRIIFKAQQYGRNVIIQEESYTSKTCGNCGILNKKLGSKRVFQCTNCNAMIDRDVNGARNIMIKGIDSVLNL
jgi:IS605 OrfB family transposase